MLAALQTSARLAVAAGAKAIATCHTGGTKHQIAEDMRTRARPGENPPLDAWLDGVVAAGLKANGVGLFSAHQMGSNRMGVSAEESVVDQDGEVIASGASCLG